MAHFESGDLFGIRIVGVGDSPLSSTSSYDSKAMRFSRQSLVYVVGNVLGQPKASKTHKSARSITRMRGSQNSAGSAIFNFCTPFPSAALPETSCD